MGLGLASTQQAVQADKIQLAVFVPQHFSQRILPLNRALCLPRVQVKINKSRNGFYIGAAIGFFGYIIQATNGADPKQLGIVELLIDSFTLSLVSGCIFFLGVSALAGRGHTDNINSEKHDIEIRAKLNNEVVTHNTSKKLK